MAWTFIIHKKTVVACVLTPEGKELKTFGTMTQDLLELADWLLAHQALHGATSNLHAFTLQLPPHLAGTVTLSARLPHQLKLLAQPGIAAFPSAALRAGPLRSSYGVTLATLVLVIAARSIRAKREYVFIGSSTQLDSTPYSGLCSSLPVQSASEGKATITFVGGPIPPGRKLSRAPAKQTRPLCAVAHWPA